MIHKWSLFTGTKDFSWGIFQNYWTKDSEINDYTLCLGSIWKDLRVNNMKKKTGLKASVKFFSVDFNPTDTLKITWKGHDIK